MSEKQVVSSNLREGATPKGETPELTQLEKVRRFIDGEDIRFDIYIDLHDAYDHRTAIDPSAILDGLKKVFEGFGFRVEFAVTVPTDVSAEEWKYARREILAHAWDKCDMIALANEYDSYLFCLVKEG